MDYISHQRLAEEHPLPDLLHHVPPIILPDQHDCPTPSAHSTGPAEPVNEIDRRPGYVVQYHRPHGRRVDTPGRDVGRDEDFDGCQGFGLG